MRRREFVKLLGAAAMASPIAARAQDAMPVIGLLNSSSAAEYVERRSAFLEGLSETGYEEHRNVEIEFRGAEGEYDRFPGLALEMVQRQVSVIVVGGIPGTLAAKAATKTIPIVFQMGGDPVELGLVASLSRPGGNLTGVGNLGIEVGPKRLELLHELVPAATTVALLVNGSNPNAETVASDHHAAARLLGLELKVVPVSSERDFEAAFATVVQIGCGGLVIGNDGLFNSRSAQLASLALGHAVPAIFQFRDFVSAGGLMSYGSSIKDIYRLMGTYTGRILQGEKPANLPVMQATKVELIINLRTATALGVTVPLSLLGRADEVIE